MILATQPVPRTGRIYPSTTATYDGDVDLIAVEYAVNGERRGPLTRDEQITAARLLHTHGHTATEIARRIGADLRTVQAWRANQWTRDGTRPAPPVKRELAPCGTPAAYKRHRSRGETACAPCRAANAAADRRYRLRGKGAT